MADGPGAFAAKAASHSGVVVASEFMFLNGGPAFFTALPGSDR
ncbi:hypothetical protein BN2364_1268 [Alloalcanivorax xenomutans]|nr:hypothetical protein BN2364_1268 [Alloalcanivorax xenomutans]